MIVKNDSFREFADRLSGYQLLKKFSDNLYHINYNYNCLKPCRFITAFHSSIVFPQTENHTINASMIFDSANQTRTGRLVPPKHFYK